ncbi:MAG: prolyl oligopeptidase family serine peptidase [Steroidobacteraceae bacterium]
MLCIQGVVDWFGPTDFRDLPQSTTIQKFLGCSTSCSETQLAAASAVAQIQNNAPPFVIMQGEADPLVVPQQSRKLAETLSSKGVKNKLIMYPGLGHGFEGGSPTKLREILSTTFTEIDRLAGKPAAR